MCCGAKVLKRSSFSKIAAAENSTSYKTKPAELIRLGWSLLPYSTLLFAGLCLKSFYSKDNGTFLASVENVLCLESFYFVFGVFLLKGQRHRGILFVPLRRIVWSPSAKRAAARVLGVLLLKGQRHTRLPSTKRAAAHTSLQSVFRAWSPSTKMAAARPRHPINGVTEPCLESFY
jgi:hypothetical protein